MITMPLIKITISDDLRRPQLGAAPKLLIRMAEKRENFTMGPPLLFFLPNVFLLLCLLRYFIFKQIH